jgi:dephospho-CoA kinase
MYVIALTGGIASGKTTLLTALKQQGAPVIDADQISRSLTAPYGEALPHIREAFGEGVFHEDGTLDRKALAAIVFSDEGARRRLEGIIHPMVAARMNRELSEISLTHKAAVADIPLLYESNMESMADEVWCVYVPKREQIRRLRARDGLTHEQALMRLKSQMDPREKCRRANHVIRTDGLPSESAAQAVRLWQEALIKLGGTRFD